MNNISQPGPPDYRSVQNASTTNQQPIVPIKTYSTAVNQSTFTFPSKKQAILFDSVDNTKLEDYLMALGQIVQPKNIIFSSKLSNNRICIYFSNEQLVEDFMNNHGRIMIKDQYLNARRLVTPSERLLLSNVCPSIPHTVIESQLYAHGIKPISPLTFLRISSQTPEFQHILSFRRQTYISPPNNITIPESILISFEQTTYRIFLTLDKQSCYVCKQNGHLAANCPSNKTTTNTFSAPPPSLTQNTNIGQSETTMNNIQQQHHTPQQPHSLLQDQPQYSSQLTQEVQLEQQSHQQNIRQLPNEQDSPISQFLAEITAPIKTAIPNTTEANKLPIKRPISEITTPPTKVSEEPIFAKPKDVKEKKLKSSPNIETNKDWGTKLAPAKAILEDPAAKYPLTFEELVDFFENSNGSPDPLSTLKIYTSEITKVTDLLTQIYPHLKDRQIKSRCTRLRNKILRQMDPEALLDLDSDSSV